MNCNFSSTLWILVFGLATACSDTRTAASPGAKGFSDSAAAGDQYGTEVVKRAEKATPYPEFLSQLAASDSLAGTVRGRVEEVCQVKGCWMTMVAQDGDHPAMTVRFEDYGFFMPKDLGGHEVAITGVAKRQVQSVEELRHYAGDAGKSQAEIEAITEPAEEIAFTATGVRVLE